MILSVVLWLILTFVKSSQSQYTVAQAEDCKQGFKAVGSGLIESFFSCPTIIVCNQHCLRKSSCIATNFQFPATGEAGRCELLLPHTLTKGGAVRLENHERTVYTKLRKFSKYEIKHEEAASLLKHMSKDSSLSLPTLETSSTLESVKASSAMEVLTDRQHSNTQLETSSTLLMSSSKGILKSESSGTLSSSTLAGTSLNPSVTTPSLTNYYSAVLKTTTQQSSTLSTSLVYFAHSSSTPRPTLSASEPSSAFSPSLKLLTNSIVNETVISISSGITRSTVDIEIDSSVHESEVSFLPNGPESTYIATTYVSSSQERQQSDTDVLIKPTVSTSAAILSTAAAFPFTDEELASSLSPKNSKTMQDKSYFTSSKVALATFVTEMIATKSVSSNAIDSTNSAKELATSQSELTVSQMHANSISFAKTMNPSIDKAVASLKVVPTVETTETVSISSPSVPTTLLTSEAADTFPQLTTSSTETDMNSSLSVMQNTALESSSYSTSLQSIASTLQAQLQAQSVLLNTAISSIDSTFSATAASASTSQVPTQSPPCSLDATTGKCFNFSSQFHTWPNAVQDCQLRNGYLAIKVDKDERKFLNELRGLKSIQETEFYVGLYKAVDGSATWVDGTSASVTLLDEVIVATQCTLQHCCGKIYIEEEETKFTLALQSDCNAARRFVCEWATN
eukprot:gene498-10177_t